MPSDNVTDAIDSLTVGMTNGMLIFVFVILALALVITGYALRKPLFAFASSGAWIILAVYSYTQSTTPPTGTWDTYYALFFLSIGMTIASALEPAIMKPREPIQEDVYATDIDRFQKEYDDLQKQARIPRIGGKKRKTYFGRIRK